MSQLAKIHRIRADLAIIRRRIEQRCGSDAFISATKPRRLRTPLLDDDYPSLSSPDRQYHILAFQVKNHKNPACRNFVQELYRFMSYEMSGPEDTCDRDEEVRALEDGGMVRAVNYDTYFTQLTAASDSLIQGGQDSVSIFEQPKIY
jgi:hypothetical protein